MMVKFDENQILKNGEYIYAQRAEIEKIADAVCEKGFDNILFTSSGGSLAMMQPFDYMISVMSNLNVQSQISAELLVEGNNHLTDKTLVFMASKSGDTKETVAAAKYVKEKGATIVSVLGVDNSPMGELSDYSVVYKDGRPQEYVLYMLIGKLLENKGFFDDYKQFADELKNLPAALVFIPAINQYPPSCALIINSLLILPPNISVITTHWSSGFLSFIHFSTIAGRSLDCSST